MNTSGKIASAEGKVAASSSPRNASCRAVPCWSLQGRVLTRAAGRAHFVRSEKIVEDTGTRRRHRGLSAGIQLYPWKLARIIRHSRQLTPISARATPDSFRQDLHPDLKADFILATRR